MLLVVGLTAGCMQYVNNSDDCVLFVVVEAAVIAYEVLMLIVTLEKVGPV